VETPTERCFHIDLAFDHDHSVDDDELGNFYTKNTSIVYDRCSLRSYAVNVTDIPEQQYRRRRREWEIQKIQGLATVRSIDAFRLYFFLDAFHLPRSTDIVI
jgi:hypothetical protein